MPVSAVQYASFAGLGYKQRHYNIASPLAEDRFLGLVKCNKQRALRAVKSFSRAICAEREGEKRGTTVPTYLFLE